MEDGFYYGVFGVIVLPLCALLWYQGVASSDDLPPAGKAFRNNYLAVFSLQMRECVGLCGLGAAEA